MAGVLQHLRSSTLNKRPNPASMVDGQIAINYASGSPGAFFKDTNGNLVKVGPVHVGTTAPNVSPASGGTAGNSLGEQWLDTSGGTYVFKIWDGAAWRSEAGEFVNAAGDTMTGSLTMGPSANLIFEGSTDDGFETTLTVVDPTADRTITLPNVSGAVVTTGDSGTVTSTMIADGTIVNADVNASAAIAGTKISPDFGSQTIQTTGVFSHAVGSAGAPTIAFTGDTNTGIYSPGADQVAISTGGSGRLFIGSTGAVGVGASDPGYALDVAATDTTAGLGYALRLRANSTAGAAAIQFTNNPVSAEYSVIAGDSSNNLKFLTSGSERLRITSAGSVGIGTSSPRAQLHLYGVNQNTANLTDSGGREGFLRLSANSSLAGAGGGILFANVQGDGVDSIGFAAIKGLLNDGSNNTSGDLAFATRTSSISTSLQERLRITSTGNVGVGTSSPSANLHVNSTGNTETLIGASSGSSVLTMTANVGAGGGSNIGFQGPLIFSSVTGAALAGATERARIDSSGRLLVGTSSARETSSGNDPFVQFERSSGSALVLSVTKNGADAFGPYFTLIKSRGTSAGANNLVSSGDELGSILFYGTDGTNPEAGAAIQAYVDGTPGTNDMPGRLVFSTTADGASSPTERARITSGGYFKASNSGTYLSSTSTEHEVCQNSQSNSTLLARASNASYQATVYYAYVDRAANTAYSFFIGNSGAGADNEFILRGDGNAFADGTWTGGGADYAEYFEWADSNTDEEDRRGISVVLDGDKIREAQAGEDPIGVISGNPSVVGDAAWNKWSGKYLRDEYGTYLLDANGDRQINPSYDPDAEYIPREQRPEWDCVGLMGKLRIRKGQVTGSRWIKMRDINDSVEEWLVR